MTLLDEFKKGLHRAMENHAFDMQLATKLENDAHKSWVQMYNHADLTPAQAQELGEIYVPLFFAEIEYFDSIKMPETNVSGIFHQNYLKLNREFAKYKVKDHVK